MFYLFWRFTVWSTSSWSVAVARSPSCGPSLPSHPVHVRSASVLESLTVPDDFDAPLPEEIMRSFEE